MASDNPCIHGINLSDYIRDPRSYNPIVYIHKQFATSSDYKLGDKKDNKTSDKCLQCDHKVNKTYKTKVLNQESNPIVEQTIKFAQDLIPLTIPPSSDDSTNVCYTIKAENKQKHKKNEDNILKHKDTTFYREKHQHETLLTNDKIKSSQSFSARDSTSRSSHNNTLDDINENRSLCCSLSEYSERKNLKRERFCSNKSKRNVHLVASESFEALAENLHNADDPKIKIHLMNEKDKGLLCESIRTPVIKTIKDCIHESFKTYEQHIDVKNIQRNLQEHSQKLEFILDKLTSIDRKFEELNGKVKNKEKLKISKLEELEQDVITRGTSSEGEIAQIHSAKRCKRDNVIVHLSPEHQGIEIKDETSVETMDRGEGLYPLLRPYSAIKTDRPGNIPARFCWTDAAK